MILLFLPSVVLLLQHYTTTIEAIMSDTCWDGLLSVEYTGTISTTLSGRTCQAWALNTPHSHTYHGDPLFPYDGGDTGAANYCRDPDGYSGASGTWCYTMDPSQRFEYCDIPLCSNLPCGGGEIVGQNDPSTLTTNIDSNSGRNYLLKNDALYAFTCCGTVQEWKFYIRNPGTIRLQVWRLDTGTGLYVLLGENVYSYSSGEINTSHSETVIQDARISVQQGDVIGWYTSGTDMISYDTGATNHSVSLGTAAPSVGDPVDFSTASIESSKYYAIGAVVAESLSPYFVSAVTTITVSTAESIGNTIFTLTIVDDDSDDVSSLTVTMDPSTFLDINGTDVTVKVTLDVGTFVLNFTVVDQCTKTGVFSLNVTVRPEDVVITSLPTIANVSESSTSETLIHTLTLTPTGNYTCAIDSYSPTRAEGNPFLVQTTPSSDIGVYLKNAANIRYNIATSYNVTVTCTSAATSSDTNYLIVDVDPNSHPVFASFQSSLTINAGSTSMNDIVYDATIVDAEADPISMTLTCDPSSCPFIINNNGEITITVDPRFEIQTTYIFIMTADDGFNTVTSSNVSVIISGTNVKPVFTNLPTSAQSVLENQSVGTFVFQVSQTDANGDPISFSVLYSSATCASMYVVNASDGSITTLAELDYETEPSCNLTLIGFDGFETSDSETLVINIVDVDEAPIFSSAGYLINTEEVVFGTALPDVSIGATDPEGTAVLLSLNCGTDSGYLTIDPTSGIVTMTMEYDIETSPTNPYTIACVVTATDATSETSTASLDVIISDGNDNQPVFSLPAYSYFLSIGYPSIGIVGTVAASDADVTSPNNAITYSMTPTSQFSIGASGSVYNTVDLSGDAVGTVYTLVVTATDGGTPALSGTATVVITILSSTTTTTTSATDTTTAGFFSETGNIVFLALAIFVAAVMAAFIAFLICRYCSSKPVGVEKENMPHDDGRDDKSYDECTEKGFNNKFTERSAVQLGQPVPYQIPEVEHPSTPQRNESATMKSRTPVNSGNERPVSNESGIHMSPVQRVSALESMRRTQWLTDLAVSPRSPAKIQLDLPQK